MEVQVQQDERARFVEHDSVRYESEDFPSAGTAVEADFYTGIDDCPWADFSWSADTPSGTAWTRVKGWT